jgi:methylenetetrahydrofolate dehydrogenase (NADP+)/methenyltetrahydrofolate cyclohydrolase
MVKLIRGKELAAEIRGQIREEVQKEIARTGCRPGLAVIQVGADPASSIYVHNKKKACEEAGIFSFGYELPEDSTQADLLILIDTLNHDDRVHGILCQLPLPKHMDEFAVICAIDPAKDVDCFHPYNIGLLSLGRDCYLPCTPAGVMEMLRSAGTPLKGSHVVIIGRSNIVGKPLAQLFLREHATVTVAHSRTQNLPELCRTADILVAAIGKPGFVTGQFIKPGAVVVDVGINRNAEGKVVGDVDAESVSTIAAALTPVPNGVGPMTIAMLLKNTLRSFQQKS